MARSFTREEFYELVWSKPLTRLAKEFYMSDVALHKICRKHDIPNPPLGWWNKKEAGQAMEKTPLPRAERGAPKSIVIANADLSRENSLLSAAREDARVLASSGADLDEGPPNQIIEATLAALRGVKKIEKALVSLSGSGLIKSTVAPASIDRLSIALPRIVRAVELQGFHLVKSTSGVCFASANETIEFSISETFRRVPHVLTPAEAALQAAYDKKEEKRRWRTSWTHDYEPPPHFPEWDYLATGQLAIELEHVYGGVCPRTTFRDGKVQRFETMAIDVAVAVAVLAAAKTDARLQGEAAERRRKDEREHRDRGLRAEHIQERRVTAFETILTELEKLDRMRQLVAALNSQLASSETARVANFVTWANDRLTELEAAISAATLEEKFEEARLFGDDDDFKFVSPPYYGY
jgi:hypothetical protein